jgi:hypothetical protein
MVTPNAGEGVEKMDQSSIAGGKVQWHSDSGKQFGSFFKNYVTKLPYEAAITLLGI